MAPNKSRFTPLDSFVDPDGPICYGILKPGEHFPGGIPVIKVKNIIGSKIQEDSLLLTSPDIHRQYKRAEVKAGDLLLTIRGTTGRVAIVPSSLSGSNITQDTARIRVSSNENPEYVYYALQSSSVQRQIELHTVGQAVKGINIAEVRKLIIFHPDRKEQNKTVKVLAAWDKAINTTEMLITNSRAQKKALMLQLLTGRKRLPGFRKKWGRHQFKDVFDRVQRKNSIGNDNVLTISAQHGLVSQRDYFNKLVASDNLENYILLNKGEFAYNKSYSNGYPYGAIKPLENYDQGVVSSLYICFRLRNSQQQCQEFFRHFFEGGCFNRELYAIAQEGARNHGLLNINAHDFFNGRLLVPEYSEQKAISDMISASERKLHNLEAQLLLLEQQKKALMQQLLTGKRRVKLDSVA